MIRPRRLLDMAMREHLASFCQRAFGTILSGDPFKPNWHLEAIAFKLEEVMAGRIKRLIITVPPRSAKSIYASVCLPAWILGRDPTRRIICVSYAGELAVKLSNQARTVMQADWYRQAFPATVINPRKNTESEFETTRGGWRMATSIGGVLTGRGANFIIIDDPIKPTDAMSQTVRDRTNAWYDLTLLSRLDDKTEGAIVLVMQRLHVDDLVGHLLARGGWEHLNLPAIAEIDETIPIGQGRFHHRRVGDLLHAAREPQDRLDELKANLGAAGFSAQYQQRPVAEGGNMFDWEWFGRFDDPPRPDEYDSIIQSWDTASKVGQLNDYSVCTTWLLHRERFYLVDLHRERLDAPGLRRRVAEQYRKYRPEAVVIEDKGSGISLIQELQYLGEVPVIAFAPEGDKQMRAHSQAARIEGGKVLLPRSAHWLDDLQTEVLAFPYGLHDDQVDSISQFLIWAFEREFNVPRIRQL